MHRKSGSRTLSAAILTLQVLSAWAAASPPPTPVPLKPKSVSATKGPFKMTLEVANTHVRDGDGLWLRLTLTNVGNRARKIWGEGFVDIQAIAGQGQIFVEVRDAKTKERVVRRLREDILLTEKLDACLAAYEKEHPEPKRDPILMLAPGKSIATAARPPVYYFAMNACEGAPPPALMPPYGEIPDWEWEEPKYEVRAVYDAVIPPNRQKNLTPEGRRNRDAMIRFETPWIELKRVP